MITFKVGSANDLDWLRPLWVEVHAHHQASMPELAPYVDNETSWSSRRRLYATLLKKDDTILLLASGRGELCGYALAHVLEAESTWAADTWVTKPRIGEIESLVVSPSMRGAGVGTRMLHELARRLAKLGVYDLIVGVLPGNDGAIRLYEREGYRRTWMYMSRFASHAPTDDCSGG